MTGNQIVQLAVDQIREDFETNGNEAVLIRKLVREQTTQQAPEPSSDKARDPA